MIKSLNLYTSLYKLVLVLRMKHEFKFDANDENYKLLNEIFKIIASRDAKRIMFRNGLKDIDEVIIIIKTIFLSIYFETDITFAVEQLESHSELRKGLNIPYVLSSDIIYNRLSRLNPVILENTVNSILNNLRHDYKRGVRSFIIDATPGDLNINFGSKNISKESLEEKDFKWGWGTAIGYYIGYKVTVVLDYKTKMPVYFMVESGSPSDTKMVGKILPILRRKKIIQRGDRILFDRGYYSYENYKLALQKYKVIPLILIKEKFDKKKLEDMLSFPLEIFKNKKENLKKAKRQYMALVKELMNFIMKTKKIKYHRGFIEDFFKIMKVGFGFKKLNRYTLKSMRKFTALNIFLAGLIVYLRIETKKDFQKFAEGTLLKCQ